MADDKKWNMLKIDLRSVLLSMPEGASFRQLNNEYRTRLGTDIPFREYNCRNLEYLIAEMPDVACFAHDKHGERRIYGVADDSTAHIARMVSLQKTKKRLKPRNGYSRPWTYHQSSGYSGSSSVLHHRAITGRHVTPVHYRPVSTGHYLPAGADQDSDEDWHTTLRNGPLTVERTALTSDGYTQKANLSNPLKVHVTGSGIRSVVTSQLPPTVLQPAPVSTSGSNSANCTPAVFQLFQSTGTPSSTSPPNQNLRNDILALINMCPGGIQLDKFANMFADRFGYNIDAHWSDVNKVRQLLESMSDIVDLSRHKSGIVVVNGKFGAKFFKESAKTVSSSVPSPAATPSQIAAAKEQVTETLATILQYFPHGIPIKDIPLEYQTQTGKCLPLRELGLASLDSLVYSLPRSLFCVETSSNNNQTTLNLATRSVAATVSPAARVSKCPDDAVGPGAVIPVETPPPVSNKYLRVRVSSTIDPGLFWIQRVGPETTDALESLMDMMQSTYGHVMGDAYILPKSLQTVGQHCAAVYPIDGQWHRCFITGFHNQQVHVCFADYGTLCNTVTSLRMLRAKYTSLPYQAIKARLANVQPVDGSCWSRPARTSFMELVNDKTLFATVTMVEQDVVYVELTDTTGTNDVKINELLIQQNLARALRDIPSDSHQQVRTPREPTASVAAAVCSPVAVPTTVPHDDNASQRSHGTDASAAAAGTKSSVSSVVVKLVELTADYKFHLIKVDDKAFMASSEVSALLWEEDVVRTKLRERGFSDLYKMVLLPEEHPAVFEILARYPISGVMRNNEPARVVVLYELSSVVHILELFHHPSEQLKLALQQQVDLFNPHDACWQVEGRSQQQQQETEEEHDMLSSVSDDADADYVNVYRRLQAKRKILYEQLAASRNSDGAARLVTQLVNQLKDVETNLATLMPVVHKRLHNTELTSAVGSVTATGSEKFAGGDRQSSVDTTQQRPNNTTVTSAGDTGVNSHDVAHLHTSHAPTNTVAPMISQSDTTAAMQSVASGPTGLSTTDTVRQQQQQSVYSQAAQSGLYTPQSLFINTGSYSQQPGVCASSQPTSVYSQASQPCVSASVLPSNLTATTPTLLDAMAASSPELASHFSRLLLGSSTSQQLPLGLGLGQQQQQQGLNLAQQQALLNSQLGYGLQDVGLGAGLGSTGGLGFDQQLGLLNALNQQHSLSLLSQQSALLNQQFGLSRFGQQSTGLGVGALGQLGLQQNLYGSGQLGGFGAQGLLGLGQLGALGGLGMSQLGGLSQLGALGQLGGLSSHSLLANSQLLSQLNQQNLVGAQYAQFGHQLGQQGVSSPDMTLGAAASAANAANISQSLLGMDALHQLSQDIRAGSVVGHATPHQ